MRLLQDLALLADTSGILRFTPSCGHPGRDTVDARHAQRKPSVIVKQLSEPLPPLRMKDCSFWRPSQVVGPALKIDPWNLLVCCPCGQALAGTSP